MLTKLEMGKEPTIGGITTPGGQLRNLVSGPLAITDKRIFIVGSVTDGFFHGHPEVRFQATYDSEYARQIRRDILVEATPKKSWVGDGDYLLLRTRSFSRLSSGAILGDIHLLRDRSGLQWELRLRKPLVMAEQARQSQANGETGKWFAPVLAHSMGMTDLGFFPITEMAQLKSQEISTLVRELETGSAPSVPVPLTAPAVPAVDAKTGSWLDGYLEPGEQVQFQTMYELTVNPNSLSPKRGRAALTDKRILVNIEHGAKKGQGLLVLNRKDITKLEYHKVPLTGFSLLSIRGSNDKIAVHGQTPEMETLKRLLEAKPSGSA